MATVDAQVASCHETAGVTQKKDCGTPIFIGGRQPAQHVVLGPFFSALRELGKQIFDHFRDNVARRDGVDADAILTPLHGQIATKLDDSGLAGIVRGANETLVKLAFF